MYVRSVRVRLAIDLRHSVGKRTYTTSNIITTSKGAGHPRLKGPLELASAEMLTVAHIESGPVPMIGGFAAVFISIPVMGIVRGVKVSAFSFIEKSVEG